jgi:hypothetical protein
MPKLRTDTVTSELTGVSAILPPLQEGLVRTRFLYDASNQMPKQWIDIWEQSINGELNPDVATIIAHESTPVQIMTGDNQITEILLRTNYDTPVGIVLMDPDGNVMYDIYDPLVDGGFQGFTIGKGWMMQMLVGDRSHLEFLDYWEPRGFCDPIDGEESEDEVKVYGQTVLLEVEPHDVPEEFARVRDALFVVINALTQKRIDEKAHEEWVNY